MPSHPLTHWTTTGTARRRAGAATAALAAIVVIGAVDSTTGSALSFAAFYVLVIVAATVAAGTPAGLATAVGSAVAWGAADAFTGRSIGLGVQVWNGFVRLAVHVIVVLLVTALLRALQAARESEERSRSFLAAAAHQLRTPVAAVSASVEALLLEGASPPQERLLANVAGETSRLGRLVTALLRTARLDQGEELRCHAVDVVALTAAELDRLRQLSLVEWRLEISPRVPARVVLDPDATRESLANVLDNAGRHAATAVEVTIAVDHGRLTIDVADDGPGLPAAAEDRAFERFVTLDGRSGTGLGLPIARELARRQGGDLVYERKTFRMVLPLIDAGDQNVAVS